jgi:hypothetical protein
MSWVEEVEGEGGGADALGLHVGEHEGTACPSGGSREGGARRAQEGGARRQLC